MRIHTQPTTSSVRFSCLQKSDNGYDWLICKVHVQPDTDVCSRLPDSTSQMPCRYQHTYALNKFAPPAVYAKKTSKNSISDFGDPQQFLKEVNFLFGKSNPDLHWHAVDVPHS